MVVRRMEPHVNVVQGDVVILSAEEAALNEAEANCASGTCTLPATQHIQLRVILMCYNL